MIGPEWPPSEAMISAASASSSPVLTPGATASRTSLSTRAASAPARRRPSSSSGESTDMSMRLLARGHVLAPRQAALGPGARDADGSDPDRPPGRLDHGRPTGHGFGQRAAERVAGARGVDRLHLRRAHALGAVALDDDGALRAERHDRRARDRDRPRERDGVASAARQVLELAAIGDEDVDWRRDPPGRRGLEHDR